jgi:hypothetical protein
MTTTDPSWTLPAATHDQLVAAAASAPNEQLAAARFVLRHFGGRLFDGSPPGLAGALERLSRRLDAHDYDGVSLDSGAPVSEDLRSVLSLTRPPGPPT